MQLQVAEDAEAELVEAVERHRPGFGVELVTHLDQGEPWCDPPRDRLGLRQVPHVEAEDQTVADLGRDFGGDHQLFSSRAAVRSATRVTA